MSSRARWRGDTTGPRAESEYAVEPVGVATMSPSAAYVVNGAPSMRTIRRTVWPDSWRSITASLSARHVQGAHVTDRVGDDREHHPLLDLVLTGAVAVERAAQARRARPR